jgi:HK97 family phage major capsid protein
MFKYKTDAEVQAMTEQEANDYAIAKRSYEVTAQKTAIETAVKTVKDELIKEVDSAKEAAKQLSLEVEALKIKGAKAKVNAFKEEFEGSQEKIKNILAGQRGEIEMKAITNRASVSGNTNAYFLPEIGQLGVKARALYDVLPKITISDRANDNGIIKYHDFDEATTVRAAAAIAEGAVFPESTAKFIERTLPIRKLGDTLAVTEEFGEDSAATDAELTRFLNVNVDTIIDSQIINGGGTGQDLTGLLASTPDFVPVASGISGANIKDLVRKMRTSIVKGRGSKYNPDFVVMNSDTFDRYYLAKDLNDMYLFDTLNGTIAGLAVVEDNNMPDNQLVVGDRRFAAIYEKTGVVLSEGFVNDQFISDTKTIKARKRLAMLIRVVDQTGFSHCTNVTTALTTLATV